MRKDNNFLKQIKKIITKIENNKKLNLKKINFSQDFDSLQMHDFFEALENFFKIKLSDKDLNYKNFSSLKNLEKIIKKYAKYKK